MPMNTIYKSPDDLPAVIPVFPLPGALLLPRGQMPLNIFEPRYLAMVDDVLRSAQRLIGMIQPDPAHPGPDENKPHLFHVGCIGRMTQFAESGDGRYLIQLTGVARFRIEEELAVDDAVPAVPRRLPAVHRRFHRAQGRGRRRPRGAAAGADRLPQGQQPQGRLGRHRERAERSLGQCAGDDVALWRRGETGAPRSARSQDPRGNPGRRHRDRARPQQHLGRDAVAVGADAPSPCIRLSMDVGLPKESGCPPRFPTVPTAPSIASIRNSWKSWSVR